MRNRVLRTGPTRPGSLFATPEPLAPFTVNNLGLQVRYRYEIGPLSELFLVYARGGFDLLHDDDRGVGDLFGDMTDVRDADQFLIKVATAVGSSAGTGRCKPRLMLFVEAAQNAAYNAPPFPAGRTIPAGIFFGLNDATRADRSVSKHGGIFVVRRVPTLLRLPRASRANTAVAGVVDRGARHNICGDAR